MYEENEEKLTTQCFDCERIFKDSDYFVDVESLRSKRLSQSRADIGEIVNVCGTCYKKGPNETWKEMDHNR